MTAVRARSLYRLAIEGGDPLIRPGFTGRSRWPRIEQDDIRRVIRLLKSAELTEMTGRTLVHDIEREMAALFGTRFALATNSGTAALHCALEGAGVGPGDEVIVPALTFVACAAAVIHQQAIPVFADVDPRTYNVAPESVRSAITDRTRAVMAVHLHGLPADLDGIRAVVEPRGIPIVEDASQAVGATLRQRPVGGFGTVGVASLMAGKNLPAGGEGGVLVTNDRLVRNRAVALKCFGEALLPDGSYELHHETKGWNYRISLVSLAVASQQLFRLEAHNEARRRNAGRLDSILSSVPGFSPPHVPPDAQHVYHMYRFRFRPDEAGLPVTADQAREALKRIFWAEGLPLVEFQNVPLPGHDLLQRRTGEHRCPWSCHGRDDVRYLIDDYPGALDVIRHSLVVGYPAQAPLADDALVALYADCFEKVQMNFDAFARIASGLPSAPPWGRRARLF